MIVFGELGKTCAFGGRYFVIDQDIATKILEKGEILVFEAISRIALKDETGKYCAVFLQNGTVSFYFVKGLDKELFQADLSFVSMKKAQACSMNVFERSQCLFSSKISEINADPVKLSQELQEKFHEFWSDKAGFAAERARLLAGEPFGKVSIGSFISSGENIFE